MATSTVQKKYISNTISDNGNVTLPFTPQFDCWVYGTAYVETQNVDADIKLDGAAIMRYRNYSFPTQGTNCIPIGAIFVPKGKTLSVTSGVFAFKYFKA